MENGTELVLAAVSFTIGYTVHYALLYGSGFRKWLSGRLEADRAEIARVVIARASLVLFFLAPILVAWLGGLQVTPLSYLSASPNWTRTGIVIGIAVVIAGLLALNPGKAKLIPHYPQMRIDEWSPGRVLTNVGMWGLYLLAYEWMFRGMLFTPLLSLGLIPAIALNTALYVAVHVPKGLNEAIGAVPFGIVACLMAYRWGSIWAPVVLHVALSVTNFFVAVGANEQMRFVRSTSRTSRSGNRHA